MNEATLHTHTHTHHAYRIASSSAVSSGCLKVRACCCAGVSLRIIIVHVRRVLQLVDIWADDLEVSFCKFLGDLLDNVAAWDEPSQVRV